jgi:hypothetical protein
MESDDLYGTVRNIALYSDIAIFVILLSCETFIFIKLRFNVDKSGIITLVLYLLISILRLISSAVWELSFGPLFLLGVNLAWITLHYFTYEMWIIQTALTSESHQIQAK